MILDQYYTKGLSKQKLSLIALELGTHWVKLSWIPKSCKTKESRVYCFGVYLCWWQKQPDLASLKCQLCSAEERVGESLSWDESLQFSSWRDYMLLWTFHSPFHPLPQDRELCVVDDLFPGSGGLETFFLETIVAVHDSVRDKKIWSDMFSSQYRLSMLSDPSPQTF